MKRKKDVTAADLEEMKMLHQSGDLEPTLDQAKALFKAQTGNDSNLNENDFLLIHAMDDDGPSGDEWWVSQMIDFEKAAA